MVCVNCFCLEKNRCNIVEDSPLYNYLLTYFYFVTYDLPKINVEVLRLAKVV